MRIITVIALAAGLLAAAPAAAQDSLMLVVDGSGSMWGQIDGEPKIAVLRRELGSVLDQLDIASNAGLIAFGHREKGNCGDIEEMIPPMPYDAASLRAAIESIQPKGKTPLSEAVRLAAESMRHTEERATVVILGDGRESCGGDPCSTAEELEATGVDFTVHAIAFDIADEEGTRQLQCFASKTGGKFFPAGDTAELVAALEEVRQEVVRETAPGPEPQPSAEPEPEPARVHLVARDAATGEPVDQRASWTFIDLDTEEIVTLDQPSGSWTEALPPGRYDVVVQIGDALGEGQATVAEQGPSEVVIEIAMAAPEVLHLSAESVPAGSLVNLTWSFAGQPDDIVFIAPPDLPDNRYPRDEVRRHLARAGQPAELVAPAEAGTYELRYFSPAAGGLVHRRPIEVTAPEVTISGPEKVIAGSQVGVDWLGPAAEGDMLFLAPTDWDANKYPTDRRYRTPAEPGRPALLQVPQRPGAYEYRYYSFANGQMLHRVPVEVALVAASVSPPASAPAGSLFAVEFSGPLSADDRLFIIAAETDANRYLLSGDTKKAVQNGSPATLVAPARPGRYEVRYFSKERGGLLARAPIEITEPEVALDAPRAAGRATGYKLRARGPNAPGDMIFIAPRDWKDNTYPLGRQDQLIPGPDGGGFLDDDGYYVFDMVAPASPGVYEIRYFSGSNGDVLGRRALIVR